MYIKKLEAVLEAVPQLTLTIYFLLRAGTLNQSTIEMIGRFWSFFMLTPRLRNRN